jgi:hypothetical protein
MGIKEYKNFFDAEHTKIRFSQWLDIDTDDIHNDNGPAVTFYFEEGQKRSVEWLINGKYHRLDGPARLKWTKEGVLYASLWCINGINKTIEIVQWINDNNIELDENKTIVKNSDKILFKLRWC